MRNTASAPGVYRPIFSKKSTIAYFAVHDVNYPRNRMIRDHLTSNMNADITVFPVDVRDGFLVNCKKLLRTAIRERRNRYDAVVLAEFSLEFVLFAWLLAKMTRAKLVVDFFVGLFETRSEDLQRTGKYTIRAFVYKALDRVALQLCDAGIIDTRMRADALNRNIGMAKVHFLPVGAPDWARPCAQLDTPRQGSVRILFYGGYSPLQAVDVAVRALALLDIEVSLTLIGDGGSRTQIESLAMDLGVQDSCHFQGRVPEGELRDHICRSDIVLGIFGTSSKAASVIANKVWQGLSCGKVVVTRQSEALDELRGSTKGQLIEVPPSDPRALADAIRELVDANGHHRQFNRTATQLATYVEDRFADVLGGTK